jgi:hypothetical protein|tara:strand:- start:612 stop:1259 length:648 start_codon:yes stop_codon:yes gene_type:complete
MIEKKIENEKFILTFCYDEKLKKFEKLKYSEKKINELEKKILNEACLLFPKCNIQELYEHLIIRIENKLRNYTNISYSGVLLPENVSKEYNYFQNFFREFLKPYIKNELNSKINFQTIKPNNNWIYLNDDQKKRKIYDQLKKYQYPKKASDVEITIIRIENKVDIFLDLSQMRDIDSKNKLCLDLEVYLKKNLDESLNVYLETVVDKNKLRRLKL